jgi:hypothetical protein
MNKELKDFLITTAGIATILGSVGVGSYATKIGKTKEYEAKIQTIQKTHAKEVENLNDQVEELTTDLKSVNDNLSQNFAYQNKEDLEELLNDVYPSYRGTVAKVTKTVGNKLGKEKQKEFIKYIKENKDNIFSLNLLNHLMEEKKDCSKIFDNLLEVNPENFSKVLGLYAQYGLDENKVNNALNNPKVSRLFNGEIDNGELYTIAKISEHDLSKLDDLVEFLKTSKRYNKNRHVILTEVGQIADKYNPQKFDKVIKTFSDQKTINLFNNFDIFNKGSYIKVLSHIAKYGDQETVNDLIESLKNNLPQDNESLGGLLYLKDKKLIKDLIGLWKNKEISESHFDDINVLLNNLMVGFGPDRNYDQQINQISKNLRDNFNNPEISEILPIIGHYNVANTPNEFANRVNNDLNFLKNYNSEDFNVFEELFANRHNKELLKSYFVQDNFKELVGNNKNVARRLMSVIPSTKVGKEAINKLVNTINTNYSDKGSESINSTISESLIDSSYGKNQNEYNKIINLFNNEEIVNYLKNEKISTKFATETIAKLANEDKETLSEGLKFVENYSNYNLLYVLDQSENKKEVLELFNNYKDDSKVKILETTMYDLTRMEEPKIFQETIEYFKANGLEKVGEVSYIVNKKNTEELVKYIRK